MPDDLPDIHPSSIHVIVDDARLTSGSSRVNLSPELIYEAALDDDLFAQLPSLIAASLGARSCVMHWRDEDGSAEISSHSRYFSDRQLADYANDFVSHDLWTDAGMRQGFVNKGWKTTDLVPSSDYARSVFYNEWIRGMGDDTYYCCGSVMKAVGGFGIIGLHRGRTQGDFSVESIENLNGQLDHLRRIFSFRGHSSKLKAQNDVLNATFQNAHHAALVVDGKGELLMVNEAGDQLLRHASFLTVRGGRLRAAADRIQVDFVAAIAAACAGSGSRGASCLLRSIDGGIVIASIMPLPTSTPKQAALITIQEPRIPTPSEILAAHLQRAFALSPAEAEIAIRLAHGEDIGEISNQRRSSIQTVRTQVKMLMSKMSARRQSDVIRTIALLERGFPVSLDDVD